MTQSDCSYITQITQALYWWSEPQEARDELYTVTEMLESDPVGNRNISDCTHSRVVTLTFRITV